MTDMEPAPQPRQRSADVPAVARLILYLVAAGIAAGIVSLLVVAAAAIISPGLLSNIQQLAASFDVLAVSSILTAPIILTITWLFVVYLDRRPFETLGYALQGTWTAEIGLGLALGIGMPLLVFAIYYAVGWTQVTGSLLTQPPGRSALILAETVLAMIAVAINEETIVRGYVLQILKVRYGVTAALVVSTLFFAIAHSANPGTTFMSFLGVFAAGLMLGYAYLASGRLWLPLAIHFGWNFTLGPVLGFPVSGIEISSWIKQVVTGPALWTGGRFGPEAGMFGFLVWTLGIAIIRWFARYTRRGAQKVSGFPGNPMV